MANERILNCGEQQIMHKSLRRSGKSKIDIAVEQERKRCLEILHRNMKLGPTLMVAMMNSIVEINYPR